MRQSQRHSQARRHGWDSHRDNHRPGDMGGTVTGQETWVGQSQARRHGCTIVSRQERPRKILDREKEGIFLKLQENDACKKSSVHCFAVLVVAVLTVKLL